MFRSSGPGGQSVNTTDSAVRITHLPTGIVVSVQNEKSQLQNKEQALRILRARLLAQAQADAEAAAAERRSQVRTVDRSQRVRTYNFPENRVSDHRVGYKAHNLDQVLDGDLDAVIRALAEGDRSDWRQAGMGPDPGRCRRRATALLARLRPDPASAVSRRRSRPPAVLARRASATMRSAREGGHQDDAAAGRDRRRRRPAGRGRG